MLEIPAWLTASLVYTVIQDFVAYVSRRRRSNSERLQLRQKWKPLFEARIYEVHQKQLRRDVIIRDVTRLDKYPNHSPTKGISPSFRLGLVGITHRGILVMLRNYKLWRPKGGEHWMFDDATTGELGERKVFPLIGTIPYDYIDNVDWEGDEYDMFPHIYCFFDNKKEPYEHLGFYDQTGPISPSLYDLPIYTEVSSFGEVRKYSKRPLWA